MTFLRLSTVLLLTAVPLSAQQYDGWTRTSQYLPMRDGEEPTTIVADGEGWDRLGWKPEHSDAKFAAAVESYR